jgi:hypothetical protein
MEQGKEGTRMRGSVRIAMTLVGLVCSLVGADTPVWSALRIDTGALIQADAEAVDRIQEVFIRAEDAIAEKNLDALMAVYSEHYRDQDRTKAEMREIWKRFFEQYDRHAPCIFSHHCDQGPLPRQTSRALGPCGRRWAELINGSICLSGLGIFIT